MNHPFFRRLAVCAVAAGALAVLPGCASSPDAEETLASMNQFGLEVAKVKDSIDATVKALEAVTGSPDGEIQANFEGYSKSVSALDKQANVVRGHAEEMKAMGDEFFKEWEPPGSVSPERRAELTASYAKIKENMTLAKQEFTPFLQSLKDVEGYLKLDPTPKGIAAMGDLAKKAKGNGALVKSRIDVVLVQVNSVRGMISTK